MSRYVSIAVGADGETITTTDRPHPSMQRQRIVNIDIGPLTIMCSGSTEAITLATLEQLHDAVSTLLAASRDRAVSSLHPGAVLTGGNVPEHMPSAYPRLSCCGGPVQIVDGSLTERSISMPPLVERVTREPQA